jgi:hypothetical protein
MDSLGLVVGFCGKGNGRSCSVIIEAAVKFTVRTLDSWI